MVQEARAVSASKGWLTPLAVLAPILATPIAGGLAWEWLGRNVGLATVAVGLTITAVVGHRTYGARLALGTAALTLVASWFAFLFALGVAFGVGCNFHAFPSGAWVALPPACGVLVYFAVGTVGFRFRRRLALLAVPLGLILGMCTMLGLFLLPAAGTWSQCPSPFE